MNWQLEGQHDADMRFKAVKLPRIDLPPTNAAHMLRIPVLPPFSERFQRLVEATYAAHGGAEYMTLGDWRDLELELKRRYKYENE